MITINLETQNNRVIVKFIGNITAEESSLNAKRFFDAVEKLDENFTIIGDYSLWDISDDHYNILLNLHRKVNVHNVPAISQALEFDN